MAGLKGFNFVNSPYISRESTPFGKLWLAIHEECCYATERILHSSHP